MISFDTNILFPATVAANPHHAKALAFLRSLEGREDVVVSEFVLVELYGLLRNAAVVEAPLPARQAAAICQTFRSHPLWRVAGMAPNSRALHDTLWKLAADDAFPRRRIFDLRMALSLTQHGVTEFATANMKDFASAGFARVWNPL